MTFINLFYYPHAPNYRIGRSSSSSKSINFYY